MYLTATTQRPCFGQDLGDYEELVVPLAAANVEGFMVISKDELSRKERVLLIEIIKLCLKFTGFINGVKLKRNNSLVANSRI